VPVIALVHRDDVGPAGIAAGQFDGYLNGLRSTGREGTVLDIARRNFSQTLAQVSTRLTQQHVIADIHIIQGASQRLNKDSGPMTKVAHAAGTPAVEQAFLSLYVPEPYALASTRDEIHPQTMEGLHSTGINVGSIVLQDIRLRLLADEHGAGSASNM